MKKITSFILSLLICLTLFAPYGTMGTEETNMSIDSSEAHVSSIVEVPFRINSTVHFSGIQVTVDYDEELELIDVTTSSKVKMESAGVCGFENGHFVFVGASYNADDVYLNENDVIFTLSFLIPADAPQGKTYEISVDSENSTYVIMSDIGNSIRTTLKSEKATIAVVSANICSEHTFSPETKVREASYVSSGLGYSTCTKCGYAKITREEILNTGAITKDGVAIRYAGNKRTGIGGVFFVDLEKLHAVEDLGYLVKVGIRLEYKDKNKQDVFVDELFYEKDINGNNNVPKENQVNLEDGKISACIEDISSQYRGRIYAYVVITDKDTMVSREEIVPMTFLGSEKISIHNVVEVMDISRYQPASIEYLSSVLDGGE